MATRAAAEKRVVAASRLLLCVPFVVGAAEALRSPGPLPDVARRAGLPFSEHLPRLTAAAMILGSVAVGTGLAPVVGGATLAGSLAATTVVVHSFWNEQEAAPRAAHRRAFFANCGLLGGVLITIVHAFVRRK
jgi:putative oxidoreductase